jgi:hypothetical protein
MPVVDLDMEVNDPHLQVSVLCEQDVLLHGQVVVLFAA